MIVDTDGELGGVLKQSDADLIAHAPTDLALLLGLAAAFQTCLHGGADLTYVIEWLNTLEIAD